MSKRTMAQYYQELYDNERDARMMLEQQLKAAIAAQKAQEIRRYCPATDEFVPLTQAEYNDFEDKARLMSQYIRSQEASLPSGSFALQTVLDLITELKWTRRRGE